MLVIAFFYQSLGYLIDFLLLLYYFTSFSTIRPHLPYYIRFIFQLVVFAT